MILLYGHGGSDNHGCEAMIRGTAENLQERFVLYSGNIRADRRYGLAQIAEVVSDSYRWYEHPAGWALSKWESYCGKRSPVFGLIDGRRSGIYLSTGGDNYCYPGLIRPLMRVNQRIRGNGNKTVLWGASIEPEVLERKEVAEDIRKYDLIFARESVTYEALLSHGIRENVFLYPDPAFAMRPAADIPDAGITSGEIIGLNISPMIFQYQPDGARIRNGFLNLVKGILEKTSSRIMLVPHVVKKTSNDRAVMKQLLEKVRTDRIFMLEDCRADELKAWIAKCSFFVGARTHATIAAYSSGVPTLVTGYSVKARGIARDLFGREDPYVVDVRSMERSGAITDAFWNLYLQRDVIRGQLSDRMPSYIGRTREAAAVLREYISLWGQERD